MGLLRSALQLRATKLITASSVGAPTCASASRVPVAFISLDEETPWRSCLVNAMRALRSPRWSSSSASSATFDGDENRARARAYDAWVRDEHAAKIALAKTATMRSSNYVRTETRLCAQELRQSFRRAVATAGSLPASSAASRRCWARQAWRSYHNIAKHGRSRSLIKLTSLSAEPHSAQEGARGSTCRNAASAKITRE